MSHHFANTPIAVVGMACRLPGARNLEEYWKLIRDGGSAIAELPPERLNRALYYDPKIGILGRTYSTLGGLIPEVPVNPGKLGLTPAVAAVTDIAHLTICDVAAEALQHARLDPFHLPSHNVGVYIGASGGSPWAGKLVFATLIEETAAYLRELPAWQSLQSGGFGRQPVEDVVSEVVREVRRQWGDGITAGQPNLAANMAAGIIARAFGLHGPHMAIDAACASSLQALMLGACALQQGRIEMAIVGGAAYSRVDTLILFSRAQSVSARGSCPFDAAADGLVPSEGYAAIVLKTLARAREDGDPICAVIRGVGMSTDGRGKSLWAPRKEGQVAAIERAYPEGLDLSQVQYVEAHATSTQVGDATEVMALCESLAGKPPPRQRIALGSSKGNIGHTLETAGLAGLTKVVLALQHAVMPPSINIQKLNASIDWDHIPFFVPRQALDWPENDGQARRAAVNAFGVGGLNVHVLVEEFVWERPKTPPVSRPAATVPAKLEPIAIIGLGAIYPGARTIEEFWNLLQSGADPKSEVPADRWNKELALQPGPPTLWKTPTCLGGFIRNYEYDWRRNKIPPKQVAQANPLQFMLLDAAEQALAHAGYDNLPFDRTRVGVVVGTSFAGDFQNQLEMGLRLPDFKVILSSILRSKGLPEDQISVVAEQYRELLLQRMPALMDETGSFTSSTLASRITKTFDLMGGAFAVDAGSGSGLAAVSSAVDILRSGDCDMVICAAGQRSMDLFYYHSMAWNGVLAAGQPRPAFDAATSGVVPGEGVGVVLLKRLADARRDGDPVRAILRSVGICTSFGDPGAAHRAAMQQALQVAQASPRQVVAIETCGGVPSLEAVELAAVAEVLKESPPPQPVWLGSVVGQLGYSGAGTGMASLLKTAMASERQCLPVGMKVTEPAPIVVKHQGLFTLPQEPVSFLPNGASEARLIGVTSGFSNGQSFFAVCEHGSVTTPPRAEGSSRVSRGASVPRPRVAWMFVGQGSQYAGMLRPLVNEFPPAAAAMERANQALAHFGGGSFADLAWHDPSHLGAEVWETQIAALIADYILAESLQALGVRPDVVAGHSFGEIPALIAAGVWSLETAMGCIRLRTEALRAVGPESGGMVAVSAPMEVVRRFAAEAGSAGLIYIANHNAPEQVVLSGQVKALARILDLAKQDGLNAVRLPVPCAFHSPMMAPAGQAFSAGLPAIPIRAARVPVLSTAFNRYMIEEEDIRRSLCEQFTQPVRYVDMVRKLAADHPTVFVEVGPQRVLTRLHQKILDGKPLGAISSDDSQRPGHEQLLSVLATLKDCGAIAAEDTAATPAGTRPGPARPGKLVQFDGSARRRQNRRQQAARTATHPETTAEAEAAGSPAGLSETSPLSGPMAELKDFMIQFIIEQTGYPEEMVDLDANLEADLGIDSIKKAQLIGEVRERFQVTPPPGAVTLDDFPTLRHVLDFLAHGTVARLDPTATAGDGGAPPAPPMAVPTPAPATGVQPGRVATGPETSRLMSRFVLRLVPASLDPAGSKAALAKRALILGDNPDANAVRDRLQKRGLQVWQLAAPADPAAAASALAEIWKDGPVPDLWLVTPRDAVPMPYGDQQAWDDRRTRGVLAPYLICQKWFERVTAAGANPLPTLVAVTALGGDLGFSGDLVSAESGGLAGLVKAVGLEAPGHVRVKVVDFPSAYAPHDLAEDVLAEVSADTPEVEIGYDAARRRHVVRARLQPASALPPRTVRPGSTWIVTGGARGVTAFVARELGRRFQLKLHLLGSSPFPRIDPSWQQLSPEARKQFKAQVAREARQKGEKPAAVWQQIERAMELDQSLRRFAEEGVPARYHPCDVSDRARLAEVLAEIRASDGPIEGVIHGAGIENAGKFPGKQLAAVSRAIAAKVDGAAALMALLQNEPPRFFLGFGSTSGRFGGIGQTDYALANDMLGKLVAQYRRQHPDCAAVCLDWTAWAEIGMAVRPESRFALEAMNVRFMPPAEGVDHILDEFQGTGADAEVLILDRSGGFFANHITMSGAEIVPEAPASTPTARAPIEPVTEAGYQAGCQYGREHRHEILSYLREFADRVPDNGAPPLPPAMLRVVETTAESELRGIAAGAEVALVSLLAHNKAARPPAGPAPVASAEAAVPGDSEWALLAEKPQTGPSGDLVATVSLCPQTDVFLREHAIYGRPVLPAVVSAEIAAEVGSLLYPERRWIGLANLELTNRCDFATDQPVHMDVAVRAEGDDARCELSVPVLRGQVMSRIIVAKAVARFTNGPVVGESMPVGEPPGGWKPFNYPDKWRLVRHGPSLRTLREVAFQPGGGQGRLVAPAPLQLAGNRPGRKWLVPSALLDGCLVACSTYAFFMAGQRVELPRKLGELLVYRLPRENEECRLQLFSRHTDAQGSRYDFHLVGDDGRAVLVVRDYSTIGLKRGSP